MERGRLGLRGVLSVYLDFAFETKELAENGVFSGIASTYGNEDRQGDIVLPGAFTQSLKRANKVPLLKAHDQGAAIGLATLSDSAAGLLVDGKLDLNVSAARETYSGLREGYLRGLSIGYAVPKGGEVHRDGGVRELRTVEVLELSVVAIPANPEARVTAVKSTIGSIRDFERFLHSAGWSRREAAAVAAHGYKGLGSMESEDAADELLRLLRGWNAR